MSSKNNFNDSNNKDELNKSLDSGKENEKNCKKRRKLNLMKKISKIITKEIIYQFFILLL